MSKKHIGRPLEMPERRVGLEVRGTREPDRPSDRDEDIDYSDIPPLDESFWRRAKVHVPPRKKQVTLRIDEDVLDWFRQTGAGYQTRMNAVLRAFVEQEKSGKPGTDD